MSDVPKFKYTLPDSAEARVSYHLFEKLMKEWVAEIGLKPGPWKSRTYNMHRAFEEWLEAKVPDLGLKFRQMIKRQTWRNMFTHNFPDFKTTCLGKVVRESIGTNFHVKPADPQAPKRSVKICEHCGSICYKPIVKAAPSVQALRYKLQEFEAEQDKKKSG